MCTQRWKGNEENLHLGVGVWTGEDRVGHGGETATEARSTHADCPHSLSHGQFIYEGDAGIDSKFCL